MKRRFKFIGAVLLAFVLPALAWQNSEPNAGPPLQKASEAMEEKASPQHPFNIVVRKTKCRNGKTAAEVFPVERNAAVPRYRYTWTVDGAVKSQTRQLPCSCGRIAQIIVERLSDGATAAKGFRLNKCQVPSTVSPAAPEDF